MRKLFAGFLCAICALVMNAADLTGRIDDTAQFAAVLKLDKVLQSKSVNEAIQENLKNELAQSPFNVPGKKLSDFFGDLCAFGEADSKQFAVFIETRGVTEAMLAQEVAKLGGELKGKVNGRDVYAFPGSTPEDNVAVSMLDSGLCLIASEKLFNKLTGSEYAKSGKLKALLDSTDAAANFRFACLIPPRDPAAADQDAMGLPLLESATVSATGSDETGFKLNAAANAVNAGESAKTQMLAQQAILMLSMVMAEKPELFEELVKAIKVDRKDKTVFLAVDVNAELGNKLAAFAKEMQSKQAAAPAVQNDGAAAPTQ